jgi:uncharacterized membrane protein YfcA
MPFDLTPAAAAWLAAAAFGAGFVRGYSGFGFAALLIAAGGLVTDPRHLVPVVLLADFALTAMQARQIAPHVQWRRVALLFPGCLAGVPLGVWALSRIGADPARIAISLFVLAICAALLSGWRPARADRPIAHLATGLVSGIANGAAVGGLPVAVFFAALPMSASAFRATLIAYFTLLDLWTLPIMAWQGMIGRDALLATALGLPLMGAGVALGGRRFLAATPQDFRRFAILILALLALAGLLRSLV